MRTNQSTPAISSGDPRGAVFVLRADLVSAEVRDLLDACAPAVLHGNRGSLADQIKRAHYLMPLPRLRSRARHRSWGSKHRCMG